MTLLLLIFWDLALPPLEAAVFLPPKETCQLAKIMNRDYRTSLTKRRDLYQWDHDLGRLMQEAERRYELWDLADDVQTHYFAVAQRRLAFYRLVRLMQWESVSQLCSERLPFPVPLGR